MKDYANYGLFVDGDYYDTCDTDSQLNDAIYGIADSRQCAGEKVRLEITGYADDEDIIGEDIPLNVFMASIFFEKFRGTVEYSVERNIMINKAGGNAGKESVNYRLSLPADMVKALGVTKEDKSVTLELTGDSIIIKKKAIG